MSPEVIICCGVGGTGKTTTSAALGVAYALAGRRTVVLTIDPARRLADALHLDALDNQPRDVTLPGGRGARLAAVMLDRKSTWDDAVRRFSDPAHVEALLDNRYYRAVSTRLSGSHEYMAVEKLYDLASDAQWDVIIVDTPPAQHALDFFQAPERVRRVFDRTALSMFTGGGTGLLARATGGASKVLHKIAGDVVMDDIAEFFQLVAGLSASLRERSAAVAELLRQPSTRYLLIAHADAPERNDLLGFLEALRERDMRFAGFLVNRVAQPPSLRASPTPATLGPAPSDWSASDWHALGVALCDAYHAEADRSRRHLDLARALTAAAGGAPAWLIPELQGGVRSLDDLAKLASHLPPEPPASL